jgi:predicted membrane-bound spermidine synthase
MTRETRKIPDPVLLALVFVTGAVVLVIELMGARAMAPFFGSGIYTWSALIAVTLAALAIGYAAGGRLADQRPDTLILFGLIMAAGLWTVLTPLIAGQLLSHLASIPEVRVGVLVSSLVLFAPNLVLLGAVGPFVIRLVTHSEDVVGSKSGLVFSVSTVGSLVGALGTGFFLAPNFGVRAIFTLGGLVLIALAAMGFLYRRRPLLVLVAPFMAMPLLNSTPAPSGAIKIVAQQPSFYGQLQVVDQKGLRVLLVDGIGQNYVDENNPYTVRYLNFLSSIIATRAASAKPRSNTLLIGAGAGHLPKLLVGANTKLEVVELDSRAISLARNYFNFSFPESRIHIADGRTFLQQSNARYDHIVIDAFSADQVASHLLSKEALTTVGARLAPGGLLAINITSTLSGEDIPAIYRTLRDVFASVRVFSPGADPHKLTSIIFIATPDHDRFAINNKILAFRQIVDSNAFIDGEIFNFPDGIILTDDYNPLGYYRSGVRSMWRASMRRFLGQDHLQWMLF